MVNHGWRVQATGGQKPSSLPESNLSARARGRASRHVPKPKIGPWKDVLVGWVKGLERIVHETFGHRLRREKHEECRSSVSGLKRKTRTFVTIYGQTFVGHRG